MYHIWIFTLKHHKKFYQQFNKAKLNSEENEQVPGVIIRKAVHKLFEYYL